MQTMLNTNRRWLLFCFIAVYTATVAGADGPRHIGSRLELFVDDFLIDEMSGVKLKLNPPIPREVVIEHDEPWEGNVCAYHTVFKDGDTYRMYYRGGHYDEQSQRETHAEVSCYAESTDGINWTKPDLDLIEFNGSKTNNIILKGLGSHNFTPFRDTNPKCRPDEKYKALGSGEDGLYAFKSPDGIHWSLMSDSPVITEGAFDSQNLAFWDARRGQYVEFHRDFRDGVRDVKTCTSRDFLNWSDPDWIDYSGAPPEHLYTNQITPYSRAPHLFLGFPMRLVLDRDPIGHPIHEVSDGIFMSSRDGRRFRRWPEAYVRPGPARDRWVNRNNMIAWGLVETRADIPDAPNELSIYVTAGYYTGQSTRLRRYTTRIDGFVSVHAPSSGGLFTTHPLAFGSTAGHRAEGTVVLQLNYSTSAAGSIKCELIDQSGEPIPGYTLNDCDEICGDEVERAVSWRGLTNVRHLASAPVRLRFEMYDADLYSIQFASRTVSTNE